MLRAPRKATRKLNPRAPEIVFHPHQVEHKGGNELDAMMAECRKGSASGWTCKKTALPGDLYVFYFGSPEFSIRALGVVKGKVEREENRKRFGWTKKPYEWFCDFKPVVRLRRPVTRSEIEADQILTDWWRGLPYKGGRKAVGVPYARRLLGLVVKKNPRWRALLDPYMTGSMAEPNMDADAGPELPEAVMLGAAQEALDRARGQGFAATPGALRAAEARAMRVATAHFRSEGFDVEDVSAHSPYDLRCTRGREVLRVEVKGTTTKGDVLLLTRNSVNFNRTPKSRMALFMLHSVNVKPARSGVVATGGSKRILRPWNVEEGTLTPIGFTWRPGRTG